MIFKITLFVAFLIYDNSYVIYNQNLLKIEELETDIGNLSFNIKIITRKQ